jgi:antitoxin MazE
MRWFGDFCRLFCCCVRIEKTCLLLQTLNFVITVITRTLILAQISGDTMEKHVRSRNIKIVPIGNSMGVRLPKKLLQKYGFANSLVLEETDRGLLLRKTNDNKLSLVDTYKAMAKEYEDWSDYDSTLTDGLEEDD